MSRRSPLAVIPLAALLLGVDAAGASNGAKSAIMSTAIRRLPPLGADRDNPYAHVLTNWRQATGETPWRSSLDVDSLPRGVPPDAGLCDLDPMIERNNECCTLFEDCRMRLRHLCSDVVEDQRNFYTVQKLGYLGLSLGGAAILANTSADRNFRNWFQDSIYDAPTGHKSWHSDINEGFYLIPVVATTWLVTERIAFVRGEDPRDLELTSWNESVNKWSERSLRALLVGAVPGTLIQLATGGSRPGESARGSRWRFFNDDNGLSGHAFVGAAPWITAARMSKRPLVRAGFYVISALPPYSRIHDDRHYLSQALLGWWLAYLSVCSVECTEWQKESFQITPVSQPDFSGIAVVRRW